MSTRGMKMLSQKLFLYFSSIIPKRGVWIFSFVIPSFLSFAQSGPEIILSDDLQLLPLKDNVYMHRSYKMFSSGRYASNGMIYIVKDKAILVDTPVTDSLTSLLISWFSEKNIQFVAAIPTHWHDDCLGGLNAVHKAGIKSYGLKMTIDLANAHDYLPPQIGFSDSLTLDLNGYDVNCMYIGAGHTLDNIVVWIPAERVLFGGCMVKALSASGLGNTTDADLNAWPFTIKHVMDLFPEAQLVIPGHGAPGGYDLLEYTYKLLTIQ